MVAMARPADIKKGIERILKKDKPNGKSCGKQLVLFSALGDLLLDKQNDYKTAMPALTAVAEADIPLVFVSGKTRQEIEHYRKLTRNVHPFICETGSAIFIPSGYFSFDIPNAKKAGRYLIIELGKPYAAIAETVQKIKDLLPGKIYSLATSSDEEISKFFTVDPKLTEFVKHREYTDTILVEGSEDSIDIIQNTVEEAKLKFLRNGRYINIGSGSVRGAIKQLLDLYHKKLKCRLVVVGIGTTVDHAPLLESVEHPVLIQKKDTGYDERIQMPYISRAHAIGPQGWNEYVSGALKSKARIDEFLWFQENTHHAKDFSNIGKLIDRKKTLNLTISLGLPALNEEKTIGNVIKILKTQLMDEYPLLDEIVVIDSNSTDKTREIAKELGVPVHVHQNTLVEEGSYEGKGEALWKSLHILKGDIIAWVDTDVENMDPKFVYGTIGALLFKPYLKYVKAYYQRPEVSGEVTQGGGRTTELAARPLFNLLFPELSGIIQPLSGEYAGWRNVLENIPFFTGYGVETGLLIDIWKKYGLRAIGQVNLDQRIHRSQDLVSLSKQAFSVTQIFLRRFMEMKTPDLTDTINYTMKMVKLFGDRLYLEDTPIQEIERPPISSLKSYREGREKQKKK